MASSRSSGGKSGAARASGARDRAPAKAGRAGEQGVFTSPLSVSKKALLDAGGRTDRKFRQLLYDFSVVGRHLEAARSHLASFIGLSSPQYNILMIVAQYQGAEGVSVTRVARQLHASAAFVTSEMRALVARGLVRKRASSQDRRSVLISLTRQGERCVESVAAERLYVNDHLFRDLSGQDFRQLARIVASLIDEFAETIEMLQARRRERTRGSKRISAR